MKVLASNNRAHQGGEGGFGEEAREIGIFLSSKKKPLRVISHRDGHSWKTFCCFLKSENHRRVLSHNHAHLTFLTLLGRLFKYLSAEGAFAIIPSSEETQLTELRMGFAANSPFRK